MMNAPSFSEDMLPRHFPKTKDLQSEQKSAVTPMPTLPGLSLLLDDDNKAAKAVPTRKVEPKKSFEQWKQQHHAILIENSVAQQRKTDKKQVRFESDNSQPANRQIYSPDSPNLELSYYESSHGEHLCRNQRQKDYHQFSSKEAVHWNGYEQKDSIPRCIHNTTNPSHGDNIAYKSQSQTTAERPYFKRTVRSESTKENCLSGANLPVHKTTPRQSNGNCCQQNQNDWEMMNYQSCSHGIQPNECVSNNQQQVYHSHQHDVQPKSIHPFTSQVERNFKDQLTDDTLLSIMEEQQKHILVQQSQIMMQQKQNMMQQKQIFMLQHQVQQLLLISGSNSNESPKNLCQTSICDKPTPQTPPNALQNLVKTPRSSKSDPICNGATAKSSIGVMTSFLGNVTDAMPNGMQQFNERFSRKLTNEKFIENVAGGEYSYKDSMLDRINDAIKNSSAMIDYRNNGTAVADGCASPKRQTDMNIAAQALFYEASSTNNGNTNNEQKTTDRSFALYMLGMKYDCAQEDAPKHIDKRDWQSSQPQSNGKSDQVSVNLSPDVYDYLKRHGLLQQE